MQRLVIAPHMDDESMGCGGLLAKFPDECTVVVVAAGDETRSREFRSAMEVLGVRRTRELNLSLIHISEPTRPCGTSRMPSSA